MEKVLSFVRTLLIAVGAFLIGHHFLGVTVDAAWWDVFVGSILTLVGGIWSWVDKELDTEKKISLVRNAIVFIGGLLVSAGVIGDSLLQQVLGLLAAILPFILGNYLRGKVKNTA